MPLAIEDYALIGDCNTAALVGRDGSIDWACFPCFDSGACFAALLGEPRHGRWLIAPAGAVPSARRRYRPGTLILETEFETSEGAVRVIDFMPLSGERRDIVRIVEGLRGQVTMRMELIIRFDYGSIVPWVRRPYHSVLATAGPDTLQLHSPIPVHGENMTTVAEFIGRQGKRVPFVLTLNALLLAGYRDEAVAWREWLLRAVAGSPRQGHYAFDPANSAAYPAADFSVEHIGELADFNLASLLPPGIELAAQEK